MTNVLTALVPRLMVPPTWEDKLDASDVHGIPTLDGFICDLKTKVIPKRKKSDMFTKTFNVNRPGSHLDYYQQMRTYFLNFSCERKELMEFLLKTFGMSITMDNSAKLIYFFIGSGDNCKITMKNLLTAMCRNFATSMNKYMLVRNRGDAGRATTWLQSLVKSRISLSDGLGDNDIINSEKLKELTGETAICYRGL